ncbi:negative elongation factor B [Capsaspora owczarzaki ATCC 30864]|uniref:Negative elongation factor B n=1 Tax=Capsaspora owczarzaki (strain ATCC 30864) TaxID=595528 RepID=A0A0D2UAE2_CAPO3|nr:negative elongation factor B [Capsaspora owczarzaki ATCC 30864]
MPPVLLHRRARVLPSAAFLLPLLDMNEIPRATVHYTMLAQLRDTLTQRFKSLSQDKLDALLERTFPFIQVPEIQPVVFAVLGLHSGIPPAYVARLAADDTLYKLCSLSVKRQIWMSNNKLFEDELDPIFNDYVEDKRLAVSPYDVLISSNPPKKRRELTAVNRIAQLVDKSIILYRYALTLIRSRFIKSHNARYCMLRAELLMALHDAGIAELFHIDPCHEFAWCWDACIRDAKVDQLQIKKSQSCFSVLVPNSPILGELAMILNDPYATGTILKAIIDCLKTSVETETLPRDEPRLVYLLHLLQIGQSAHAILQTQSFVEPPQNNKTITTFLPLLTLIMVEDALRKVNNDEEFDELPRLVIDLMNSDPLSRRLMLFYVLDRIQARDGTALRRTIPAIEVLDEQNPDSDSTFFRTFISLVLSHKEDFTDNDIRFTMIEDFLLKFAPSSPAVQQQIIRLLMSLHTKFEDANLIDTLRVIFETCSLHENLKEENLTLFKAYNRLAERLVDRIGGSADADFFFLALGRGGHASRTFAGGAHEAAEAPLPSVFTPAQEHDAPPTWY